MNVKLCRICGYELARKAKRCSWCKTPVKKITALHYSLLVLSVFFILVALSNKNDSTDISPPREQTLSSTMKTASAQQPVSLPTKKPAKVNVKEEIAPLRQPAKTLTPYQAYRAFRKYFNLLNSEIKKQKGMTFFENVEYLDNGVIQVTATDIFLSAPETYKQNYLRKMEQKWLDLREPSQKATLKIVDSEGILRMEKKRG
jgi:uncharacterized protein with NAD-binding domain and iron-sulfur cluster